MKLYQALEQVNDRDSFLGFVRALIADCKDSEDWQNATIENFLEAALAWAEDTHMRETQGFPAEPSWKAFAVFLYCGKIYE